MLGAIAAWTSVAGFAQTQNFEGNALNFGLGNMKFKNETSSATAGKWKNVSNIEFVHFKSLDDKWLLGFGVGYSDGGASFGSSASADGDLIFYDSDGSLIADGCDHIENGNCYAYQPAGKGSSKLKQSFELSLIPSYAFSNKQLGFIRLGFSRAKVVTSSSGGEGEWIEGYWPHPPLNGTPDLSDSGSSASGKANLNGYVLGIGYRHQFDNNWFLQGECKVVQYSRNNTLNVKPSSKGLVVGAGYRF